MKLRHFLLAVAAVGWLAACQTSTSDQAPAADTAKSSTGQEKAPAAKAQGRSESTPRPRPQPIVIPEGTRLSLALETTVSSATNHAGDVVVARLTEPVRVGERVVIPEGSRVTGHVTAAVASGRVKGRARLAMAFEVRRVEGPQRRHRGQRHRHHGRAFEEA